MVAEHVAEATSSGGAVAAAARASAAAQRSTFVPRLRLFSETLLVEADDGAHREQTRAVLALRFAYAHGVLRPSGSGTWTDDEAVDSGPVDRDAIAEARAQQLLEGFGAVEIACLEHVLSPYGAQADYLVAADEDVHAACSFTACAVPRLRQLGWEVEIATDYPYQVVDSDAAFWAALRTDASGTAGAAPAVLAPARSEEGSTPARAPTGSGSSSASRSMASASTSCPRW